LGEPASSDGDREVERPGMPLIGGSVIGALLEAPEDTFRRGGGLALGGECEAGDAREEGPLLLASLSISADRVISGLA
jgi:hypothetical protein